MSTLLADPLLQLLLVIGVELAVFFALRAASTLGLAAVAIAAMVAIVVYLPLAWLHWPGADMFTLHLTLILTTGYVLALVARRGEHRTERRGFHWAPAFIVIFMVFIVLLNVVMITVSREGMPPAVSRLFSDAPDAAATSSVFPGVVGNNLQKKEAQYNAFLAQQAVQRARGWQVQKGWLDTVTADRPAVFQVVVETREGAPVTGAEVGGRFLRASDSRADQAFRMRETAPGTYQAELTLPLPGAWSLELVIVRGEDRHEVRAGTRVAAP